MLDVLLLEPGYRNKYPPLGLMKIAYYHRKLRGDYVRFQKGRVANTLMSKKWDRIYISTLFTFEWDETIDTIKHAIQVAKDKEQIFIGGVLATLLPEDLEEETGIKPICGLLDKKGKLGYEDDNVIDTLPPDYSILQHIKDTYQYPYEDAYFAYTTRGCGMNCDFCAVNLLEPNYEKFIPIKQQIEEIKSEFGEKKDLLLMDNNVLKSPCFSKIVDEIKAAGFYKGATYVNPKTKKRRKRFVDFNQGLDANFLTEEKARKLGELALNPARIAFDHIEDKETYIKAMKRCVDNGIRYLSNYLLFNTKAFYGKGHEYKADNPENLYCRLKITMDIKEQFNKGIKDQQERVHVYSFPMKYVPFNKKREFVGDNWNQKFLRAIQVMLVPTQGKGVSGKSFFEADFGKDVEEFKKILSMPEKLIGYRGHFVHKEHESVKEKRKRYRAWQRRQAFITEWNRLFDEIKNKDLFINRISKNKFSPDQFFEMENEFKKIYLHYLTNKQFFGLCEKIYYENYKSQKELVMNYVLHEFPVFKDYLSNYIIQTPIPPKVSLGFFLLFEISGVEYLLEKWVDQEFQAAKGFLDRVAFGLKKLDYNKFNVALLDLIKNYQDLGCFGKEDFSRLKYIISSMDEDEVRALLRERFDDFKEAFLAQLDDKYSRENIQRHFKRIVDDIEKQLSLFD